MPATGSRRPGFSLLAAVADATKATRGLLEFPLDGRYASGVGTFTAWLCEALSVPDPYRRRRADEGGLRNAAQ